MLEPQNVLKPTVNVYVGVSLPTSFTSLLLIQGIPVTGRHLGLSGAVDWRYSLARDVSREMTPLEMPPDVIDGDREFEIGVILYEWTAENFDLLSLKQSILVVYEYTRRYGYIFLYYTAAISEMESSLTKREFARFPLTFRSLGVEGRSEGDQAGQIQFLNGAIRYF